MEPVSTQDLADEYHQHNPMDPDGRPLPFDDYLIAKGHKSSLPQRSSADITPLIAFLDRFVFVENGLQQPTLAAGVVRNGSIHDRFGGLQAVISDAILKQQLGEDHAQRYHVRDWTDAVKGMLVARGCPERSIVYGTKYRVVFHWPHDEGNTGVFVCIDPALLSLCSMRDAADRPSDRSAAR